LGEGTPDFIGLSLRGLKLPSSLLTPPGSDVHAYSPIVPCLIRIPLYNNSSMGFTLQIKLEREDKRMKLTLPYNPTYIKKIKLWLFSG